MPCDFATPPVRNCQGISAELLPLSCYNSFSLCLLSGIDRYGRPTGARPLGFGSTPSFGREGWKSRDSETASPPSVRTSVHQGAESLSLDCVGLSAPRVGPPRCDGRSVPLFSIPTAEPMGPGRHRPHRAGRATGPPGGALPTGLYQVRKIRALLFHGLCRLGKIDWASESHQELDRCLSRTITASKNFND